MSKGRHIAWSADELAWIRAFAEWPRRKAHADFCSIFGRDDVSLSNYVALCKRNGWLTGRDGRFTAGQEAFNKGVPCPEGSGGRHPNARATQFKKGVRRGVAAKLHKPIGTERISKDGYRERKIHDGLPLQSRWRGVHLLEWEKINGPLPKGKALKCLDGDRLNTDPANWMAVPRAMLPRLAGARYGRMSYDDAPAELKPVLLAIAKVEHAARERRKA